MIGLIKICRKLKDASYLFLGAETGPLQVRAQRVQGRRGRGARVRGGRAALRRVRAPGARARHRLRLLRPRRPRATHAQMVF